MIDMQGIFSHLNYDNTLEQFEESDCDWSVFKALHQEVANNKCPICEVELVQTPNHAYSATIDHFRPKDKSMYPHLRCIPENYILMCNLCNTRYKKANFPLVDDSQRAVTAKTMAEIIHERPLLFNPAEDDPRSFFELAFRQTERGNILELKRKSTIPKGSYEYQRCEAMITLFGLGYTQHDIHPDEETKKLRIDVLTAHYEVFIKLAQAINDKDKKAAALILQDKNRKIALEKYGFWEPLWAKEFFICSA